MDRKARVLVVDDESVNIRLMEKLLQDSYDISTALSGSEALVTIKEQCPDIILLDVMMPDLSGFELCRIILADERYADIPILFLTALDTLSDETEGLEAGGVDFLTKPINLGLLKLKVRNHLKMKNRSDVIKEQRDLLARQKEELEAALNRVKLLEGIIPICMYCKKIRKDDDSWQQLESYISAHSEALFSHGVCPDCLKSGVWK